VLDQEPTMTALPWPFTESRSASPGTLSRARRSMCVQVKKAVSNSVSKDDDRGTTSCHALLRRMELVGERLMIVDVYVKTQDLIEQAGDRVDQGIVEEACLSSLQLRLQSGSRSHCLLSGKRDEEKRKEEFPGKRRDFGQAIHLETAGPFVFVHGSLSSMKVFSDRSFCSIDQLGNQKRKIACFSFLGQAICSKIFIKKRHLD